MPKARLAVWEANQFTPEVSAEVDWLVPDSTFPDGSTLNRTWIDVRFNQFGINTVPPDFVNSTGPIIWGVTLTNDSTGSPGVHTEDDTFDWLWREMVVWGPPVATVTDVGGDKLWTRSSQGSGGWRASKGQRKRDATNTHLHFAFNVPTSFGSGPTGVLYEVFIHTLWTVP